MSLTSVRTRVLSGAVATGTTSMALSSAWRTKRLLILCYHGISIADEHDWNGLFYVDAPLFAARLQALHNQGCNVLPLGEAVQRLGAGTLPKRAIVITFDDGFFDFLDQAWPVLKRFGFPVTVYQTTYYSEFQAAVPMLACGYMLSRLPDRSITVSHVPGLESPISLLHDFDRQRVIAALADYANKNHLSAAGKDELVQRVAAAIGFDYEQIRSRRILHCMTPEEISVLSREGVEFQLHTHRHRTPRHRELFLREIDDNIVRLREWTGKEPHDFCYPSGVHSPQFVPWLHERSIRSATTCEQELCTSHSDPLFLPRFLDTALVTNDVFAAWVSGLASVLPPRGLARFARRLLRA